MSDSSRPAITEKTLQVEAAKNDLLKSITELHELTEHFIGRLAPIRDLNSVTKGESEKNAPPPVCKHAADLLDATYQVNRIRDMIVEVSRDIQI